ncbi:MAG TPA: zinc-dependent metalloprotease [Thermoanaerobaculia bacterium]|nr:zinc-dependent metalloprotease [Thermoanaerobaculia bacterium]
MIRRFSMIAAILTMTIAPPASAWQATTEKTVPPAISAKTAGLQRIEGFIPLYWDAAGGKLLMDIARFDTELLYQTSLPAGLGSNPVGLDRNQLGETRIVTFRRIGPKVLMIQPNYDFRAITVDPAEAKAVEESFAQSVLWGFKVEAEEGGRVLVDATGFFLRDAHEAIDRLRASGQGSFALDESRSAIDLARTKGFPKNTEVEAIVTFVSGDVPGPLVRSVVPHPKSITLRLHHSLVELPAAGYEPRRFDPRVGMIGIAFHDFASPLTEPIEKRWIIRHRLQKKDPAAAVSDAVSPIVYYLDPGTPEPVRSALLDGGAWWSEAFEAIGFRNAFQVRMLPAEADPMDLRYNMITWVHRSTRGWSYGASVVDPRTGEILKGNVSLGSLRVRHDFLLAAGMIPMFGDGAGESDYSWLASLDPSVNGAAMALARLRQLSAHEVGHTIGLTHNFAASTYGRASVMDYPAPLVEIREGRLDLTNAYSSGVGAFDRFAIEYAYSQFPSGVDEEGALQSIVRRGIERGMLFIGDSHARPTSAAHPLASLWDNGPDPVAMLRHEMEVRRIGLRQFGLGNIAAGEPLVRLEATLLPLYLHHRYQLQAAAKYVGGMHFSYSVREKTGAVPPEVTRIASPAEQRAALEAVLDTLLIDELRLPERILALLPPPAYGYEGPPLELFPRRTDPVFDPIAAATVAAEISINTLLDPKRAARLVQFHARDQANPGFTEVIDKLTRRSWDVRASDAYGAAIVRAVQSLLVARLMNLAADPDASPDVRAIAADGLRGIASRAQRQSGGAPADQAHRNAIRDDIERFLTRPEEPRKRTTPLPMPQGEPIG